jgi:YVTN family beta-propeller protein
MTSLGRCTPLLACGIVLGALLAGCQGGQSPTPARTAVLTAPATVTEIAVSAPGTATPRPPTATPVTPATATLAPGATATPSPRPTLPAQPTVIGELRLGSLPAAARYPGAAAFLGDRLYVLTRADAGVAVIEGDRLTRVIPACKSPAGLLADAAGDRLIVSCDDDKQVQVIQGDARVAVWDLGFAPDAIALAGNTLYIAFSADGESAIAAYDAGSGARLRQVSLGALFGLRALAIDGAARRLYVSGYEQVVIVDLDELTVIETHKLNSYGTLAVDPSRRRWYASDYDSNSNTEYLVAFDARNGNVLGRAPLGGDPRQGVIQPASGRIYVANAWSGTVSVIEPERMTTLATIPVGRGPNYLALDPAGRRLYAVNRDVHNVAVIDTTANQVVATIPLALLPSAMAADGARNTLYIAMPATNSVFVVRQDRALREWPAGIEPTAMTVDPQTGALYVVSYFSQSLTTITPDTWKSETTALSGRPMAVALDPTGRRLFAGNDALALDGMRPLGDLHVKGVSVGSVVPPSQSAFDPTTGRLFIVANNGIPGSNNGQIIYVLDPTSGQQTQGQLGSITTLHMVLDAAGRRLFSTAGRPYAGGIRLYMDDPDNLRHIADRPLNRLPAGLAYVPATNHLFVPLGDTYSGPAREWELAIYDSRTLGEVARWPLDEMPAGAAADPINNRVYVPVGSTGRVLIIQDVPLPAPPAPTPTRTPTPWPTWTPSPTPVPATVRPTNTPLPCNLTFIGQFGPYWTPAVEKVMGCPAKSVAEISVADQPFERGRMLWRGDIQYVYALGADGRYFAVKDAWVGPAEIACEANPPAGLYQPRRGFGLAWCSIGQIRDALGWATQPERGYRTLLMETANGFLILTDDGRALGLTKDGAWRSFVKP